MTITEFDYLDPDRVDAVSAPANGTAWLMLKSQQDRAAKDTLNADDRHALSDSDFAYIDADGDRHLPINDESHVKAAIARFNQTHFESDAAKKKAARKIMAAAKKYNIDVSDDDNVAQVAKATESPESSLGQTRENAAGTAMASQTPPADDGRVHDGGEPSGEHYDQPRPPESNGEGDTAPDKSVPESEALSQTAKADVDLTGDHEDHSDDGGGKTEAESQTREVDDSEPTGKNTDQLRRQHAQTQKGKGKKKKKGKPVSASNDANTPGSPAWEHKDVQLADNAEAALENALRLVREFAAREKTEAAKQAVAHLGRAASALGVPATKGTNMNELTGKKAKKAKKAEGVVTKADKAIDDAKSLRKQVKEMRKQLDAIAKQDAKPAPLLNTAGIPRGADAGTALKSFQDAIDNARNEQERREAHRKMAVVKTIAASGSGRQVPTVNGLGTPLISNRYELAEDSSVRGV